MPVTPPLFVVLLVTCFHPRSSAALLIHGIIPSFTTASLMAAARCVYCSTCALCLRCSWVLALQQMPAHMS
jgi:hypothetical protein